MKQRNQILQKQAQTIKLSESMQLSLAFLQMSIQELKETLEKELSENPIAEMQFLPASYNENAIEAIASSKNGIEEILDQLKYCKHKVNLYIAEYILANCDTSGYLKISAQKLASVYKIDVHEVEKVRQEIMKCLPYGIASYDLKECLLSQLEGLHSKNKLLKRIIRHHLEDVAAARMEKIIKQCKTTMPEVKQALTELHELNPRPGLNFDFESPVFCRPDLKFIEEMGEIQVHPIQYFSIKSINIETKDLNKEERKYIREQQKRVHEIEDCLEKRAASLTLLGQHMANIQKDYLLHGSSREILKIKDLAQLCDLHETTISRALKDKSFEFGNQVYELKSLLSREINEISADHCKKCLKQLILEEEKALSDLTLSALLKEEGIIISRRTVAKYREEMNIANASVRRRMKKYEDEC